MCDIHIDNLAVQSIEFNVTKDLIAVGEIIFQQKQKSLLYEKQKLNELHLKVWNDENKICDDVWKFSQEYNFYTIIKQYADATEKKKEKTKRGRGTYITDDIEWITSIGELNYEIETIEREIRYLTENDLTEKNLKEAVEDLKAAQCFPKENNDVKSLLRAMENSRQEILAIECEIKRYMKIQENNKIILSTSNWGSKNKRLPEKAKRSYNNSGKNISNNQTNINDNNNIITEKKQKKSIPLPNNMSQLEFMTPVTVAMNDDVEVNTIKNKSRLSLEQEDLLRKFSYFEKRSSRLTKIVENSTASKDQMSFIAPSYKKHDFTTAKTISTNNNSMTENCNENINSVQYAVSQKHVTPIILSPSSFLIALKNTMPTESYSDNEFSNSHRSSEINELTKQSNTKAHTTSGKYMIKKRSTISLKLAERRIRACRSKVVPNM